MSWSEFVTHQPQHGAVTDSCVTISQTGSILSLHCTTCSAVISHKAHCAEQVGKAKLQIYSLRHFQRHGPTVKRSVGIDLSFHWWKPLIQSSPATFSSLTLMKPCRSLGVGGQPLLQLKPEGTIRNSVSDCQHTHAIVRFFSSNWALTKWLLGLVN